MRYAKGISMLLALATLAAPVSCGSGAGENPEVTTGSTYTTMTGDEGIGKTRL